MSGSHQAVIKQSSGSRQAVIRHVKQPSKSRQAVVKQSSGSHQAVFVRMVHLVVNSAAYGTESFFSLVHFRLDKAWFIYQIR